MITDAQKNERIKHWKTQTTEDLRQQLIDPQAIHDFLIITEELRQREEAERQLQQKAILDVASEANIIARSARRAAWIAAITAIIAAIIATIDIQCIK